MVSVPLLETIWPILKVRDTGDRPVQVYTSDFAEYICKYHRDPPTPAGKLFNEWLASHFLPIWEVPTPSIALIRVLPEHIPSDEGRLQPIFFKTICFGSRFIKNVQPLTLFADEDYAVQHLAPDLSALLRLILFDIWTANEDRAPGNPNVLLEWDEISRRHRFVAIDHSAMFNSNSLMFEPAQLTWEDSLLSMPLVGRLLRRHKKQLEIAELKNRYYFCVHQSRTLLPDVVSGAPTDWNIEPKLMLGALEARLFADDWVDETFQYFSEYLQQAMD